MNIRIVALLAAVLPFAGVHLTWLLAAFLGLVEWCNPYIDSCTSISATGRRPPASYLFRATMLPAAVVLAAYWWCSYSWLRSLSGETAGAGLRSLRWMLGLGLVASIGLILYVTVLGEAGDVWRRQRRAGTVLFFSFTFISQLLLSAQLRRLAPRLPACQALARSMWYLCCILLALGILTLVLQAWYHAFYDSVEDAFEWVLSLLLQANFLLGYFCWRRAGWQLQVVHRAAALPHTEKRTDRNQA